MRIGIDMTISGSGYRVSTFSGTDYGALAIANGLTLVGWYRSDLGVTGTSGTGKASWAPVAGSLSAITPHGGATNGIGSVTAGLNGKAGLKQDGATQKGLFTAPALSLPSVSPVHKYWIARQASGGSTAARGILQDAGANDIYLLTTGQLNAVATNAAPVNITQDVWQRCSVSWAGAASEIKVGSTAASVNTGSNAAHGTARTFSDLLTNWDWLMYLEVTGTKANFNTFRGLADTAARTVDWTTAIEI